MFVHFPVRKNPFRSLLHSSIVLSVRATENALAWNRTQDIFFDEFWTSYYLLLASRNTHAQVWCKSIYPFSSYKRTNSETHNFRFVWTGQRNPFVTHTNDSTSLLAQQIILIQHVQLLSILVITIWMFCKKKKAQKKGSCQPKHFFK